MTLLDSFFYLICNFCEVGDRQFWLKVGICSFWSFLQGYTFRILAENSVTLANNAHLDRRWVHSVSWIFYWATIKRLELRLSCIKYQLCPHSTDLWYCNFFLYLGKVGFNTFSSFSDLFLVTGLKLHYHHADHQPVRTKEQIAISNRIRGKFVVTHNSSFSIPDLARVYKCMETDTEHNCLLELFRKG